MATFPSLGELMRARDACDTPEFLRELSEKQLSSVTAPNGTYFKYRTSSTMPSSSSRTASWPGPT